jgi:hypothetical protein
LEASYTVIITTDLKGYPPSAVECFKCCDTFFPRILCIIKESFSGGNNKLTEVCLRCIANLLKADIVSVEDAIKVSN